MKKLYDVIGAGISAVDDLLFVAGIPQSDCKAPVLHRRRCGGGPVCTGMAAVGSLGGSASFLARLGEDPESRFIHNELERHGVGTDRIILDRAAAPYRSVIVVNELGQRAIFYDSSAYRRVTSEDVDDCLVQSSRILLLDYLSGPPALDLAKKANRLGVPTVGDIEGQSQFGLELAALIDYLVVPEDFALWATGERIPAQACAALATTSRKATVVTCGARGGHYCAAGPPGVQEFSAFPIEAFDTTGCGDVFHGAFALAIARDVPIRDAIHFAAAAAALKANASQGTRHGWNALPSLHEVFDFLRERLAPSEFLSHLEPLKIGPATGALRNLSVEDK